MFSSVTTESPRPQKKSMTKAWTVKVLEMETRDWWTWGLLWRRTSKVRVSWLREAEVIEGGRETVGRRWKMMEDVVAETEAMYEAVVSAR